RLAARSGRDCVRSVLFEFVSEENPPVENYANPKTCLFHVLFKGAALAFYILSALFFNSFVIIFVVTVLLAALDFWWLRIGRILVGLRWWNEINDLGESSLARMNKKDSWLFWWTLYLAAAAWLVLGIFSLIRFQADYLLVVGVCLSLNAANIIGFTKCKKDAKNSFSSLPHRQSHHGSSPRYNLPLPLSEKKNMF
ncbi:LOW QUALITY PROTEIN: hypothetical protein HID58_080852, partial [Brassica napus]